MLKRSFLLTSIFAVISAVTCNPLDIIITHLNSEENLTLRELVRRVNSHSCGSISVLDYMSVPGYEHLDPALDKPPLEIVCSLRKSLEEHVGSYNYAKRLELLKNLPVDFFSIEPQIKEWKEEHSEDDASGDVSDIAIEIVDEANNAMIAYLANEKALFDLLEIAESYFALQISPAPTSHGSSTSASPETPSRRATPPAGSPSPKIASIKEDHLLQLEKHPSLNALKLPKPKPVGFSSTYRQSPLSPRRVVATVPTAGD